MRYGVGVVGTGRQGTVRDATTIRFQHILSSLDCFPVGGDPVARGRGERERARLVFFSLVIRHAKGMDVDYSALVERHRP